MGHRRLGLALLLLGAAGALGAAGLLLHRAGERTREALVAAEAPRFTAALLPLPPPAPRAPQLTHVGEAYDAAWQDGHLHVASAGGLLRYQGEDGGGEPQLLSQFDGLSGVSLRSLLAGPPGGELLIGDDAGGLSRLGAGGAEARATAARVPPSQGGAAPGSVLDMVELEGSRYLLVRQVGLLRLDGAEVTDEGRRAGLGAALAGAAALCAGPAGLFVGTEGGELFLRRGGRLERVGAVEGPITALSCAGADLLVGTALGLLRRRATGEVAPLLADLLVTSILEQGGEDGEVLVATLDDGVLRLRREGERLAVREHLLPGRRVRRLRRGPGAVAALGAGAFLLQPGGARALPLPPGLSGPHVTALCRDGAGRLWIGTFEQGLDRVEGGTFPGPAPRLSHRPLRPEPRADNVNALLCRGADVLAATAGGIDVYGLGGEGAPRRLGVSEGLLGESVQALAVTGAGLWAATGRGLSLLPDPGAAAGAAPRGLTAFHGLLSNRIYALAAGGDRLYVGTLAGLSIVDPGGAGASPGRVLAGHGADVLGAGWVSALARCGEDLYIATYGGPLSVLARGEARPRPLPGPRLHVNPGALLCDGEGLWIGTQEAGLLRLAFADRTGGGATLRALDERALPARSVTALFRDPAPGAPLYIGTEAGVVAVDAPALAPLR